MSGIKITTQKPEKTNKNKIFYIDYQKIVKDYYKLNESNSSLDVINDFLNEFHAIILGFFESIITGKKDAFRKFLFIKIDNLLKDILEDSNVDESGENSLNELGF